MKAYSAWLSIYVIIVYYRLIEGVYINRCHVCLRDFSKKLIRKRKFNTNIYNNLKKCAKFSEKMTNDYPKTHAEFSKEQWPQRKYLSCPLCFPPFSA